MAGYQGSLPAIEEVIFTVRDRNYPFVGISAAENCQVHLERMLPREEGVWAEFFSVVGADSDAVVAVAEEHPDVEPAVLVGEKDGGLFEFRVCGGCPARHLAELGALPRAVESSGGDGRIVAEILPGYATTDVVAAFLDEHESVDLIAKREKRNPLPLFTERELKRAIDSRLTDRQREVLRTAFEAGYYEQPRTTTGEKIAEHLEISSPTFSQHIRTAERKLLAILYEDGMI